MQRFFIQNFGCRATQADGAALEAALGLKGLEPAERAAAADLVILNTCTVTAAADEDVRKSIHRVHRENPDARILVTGCYAQRSPEELIKIPGVNWVVGNSHKTQIPDILELEPAPFHGQVYVGDIQASAGFLSGPVDDAFGDRTRPNLKIQDGCNNPCSFCIIPAVRGRSRSMPAEVVVEQVAALAENYREVVLTGINLGRWGRETGSGLRLADLVERLLKETRVELLRISSVEPMDMSGRLLELMASTERIARHVHLPLQSGSDAVLKRMKRRYRVRHYEERLMQAHALLPDAALGADVMTGFPGESEAEFEETVRFIERLPLTYLHVFTYSARPGTPAAEWLQLPPLVRKERTRALRALAERKNRVFREEMVGRTLRAVTLADGTALTTNYLRVELREQCEANRLVEVRIGGVTENGVAEAGPVTSQDAICLPRKASGKC